MAQLDSQDTKKEGNPSEALVQPTVLEFQPTVLECRVTWVWTGIFRVACALIDPNTYEEKFNAALRGEPVDLHLPWPAAEKPSQAFWQAYLHATQLDGSKGNKSNTANRIPVQPLPSEDPPPPTSLPWYPSKLSTGTMNATQAREYLMPLRWPLEGKLVPDSSKQEAAAAEDSLVIWPEVYLYPHGVSVLFTLRWRGSRPMDSLVCKLHELRKSNYVFRGKQPTISFAGGLDRIALEIATEATNQMRMQLDPPQLSSPWLIATVIDAEDATTPAEKTNSCRPEIRKGLVGLAFLRKVRPLAREALELPLNGETLLRLSPKAGPDAKLFALCKARVVWIPKQFSIQKNPHGSRRIRGLGRYHRNLTLATMQTEYLLKFLDWAKSRWPASLLTVSDKFLALRAAEMLADLHSRGIMSTYRTLSVKHQIERRLATVNFMITRYGSGDILK